MRLSQVVFSPRILHLKVSPTLRQTDYLNTMGATKVDDQRTGASKRLSNNTERQHPVTTLSDAYPNNIVVQHMMPTTVSQFVRSVSQTALLRNALTVYPNRTLLAIFGFLVVSHKFCAIWSQEAVCASRISYLAHGIGMVLSALTAYTYILRWKLTRRGRQLPVTNDVEWK